MNERIQLPAQEWLGYDPEKGDIHGYTFEQMREFAESIIRECLLCCERVISDPVPQSQDTWLNGGLQCMEEIKHNFGIK